MLTFSELLNYFRDALRAFSRYPLNYSENSLFYSLGQSVASLAAKNEAAIENMITRLSLTSAVGTDLDNLMGNFQIYRKPESQSIGYVNIYATTLPTTNIFLSAGTAFVDENGQSFVLTQTAIIPSSTSYYPLDIVGYMNPNYYALPLASNLSAFTIAGLSVEEIRQQLLSTTKISSRCDVAGLSGNIGARQINATRAGNIKITNPEQFSGGANAENDESFRSRGLSIIRGSQSKFTSEALRGYLLTQQGVMDAKIIEDTGCITIAPPPSGHIYAIINTKLMPEYQTSYASYPALALNSDLYQLIRNSIEIDGYRPCGIGITVREADIINAGFTSDAGDYLTIYVDSSIVPSIAKVELQNMIFDYFVSTKIGQSIYPIDIYNLIKSYSGVVTMDNFTFLQTTGFDSVGADITSEVSFLNAACNQVFRIRGPEYVNLEVEYVSTTS
jgi:uncharacterized phage protein gp47/JayE